MATRALLLVVLTVTWYKAVTSLRYDDFQEGSCLRYRPQQDFNATWFATVPLPYVAGGSRYHLFRMTSGYTEMPNLREFEFLYDSCLQSYANTTTGIGQLRAFGAGVIGTYDIVGTNQNGVLDFVRQTTPGLRDVSRHTVTLTDNRSFVFFANCWKESNQRGWDLVSLTPTLDARTQKLIEDHATSLGFDREQFVFLRFDSCWNKVEDIGEMHRQGQTTAGRKTGGLPAGLGGDWARRSKW